MTTVEDADEKLHTDDSKNYCHKFLCHGDLRGAWLNACGNYFYTVQCTVIHCNKSRTTETQSKVQKSRKRNKQARMRNEKLPWRIQWRTTTHITTIQNKSLKRENTSFMKGN